METETGMATESAIRKDDPLRVIVVKRSRLVFLLALGAVSRGEAVESACPAKAARDVLTCVLSRHPDARRAQADVNAASFLIEAAAQRPNPELDGQVTRFGKSDAPGLVSEANVLHTYEWGGKRDRRIAQAGTRQAAAAARLLGVRERLALETVLKLHRLRQIGPERRAVEESVQTFSGIIRSLQARRRRSAEQNVSLNIFLLAEADYHYRLAALEREEDALLRWFDLASALPKEVVLADLPQDPGPWPDVAPDGARKNAVRRAAEADLAESRANQRLADSQVWPDVKAGPRVDAQSGHGQDAVGVGAALSMALPLYQSNAGERRLARARVDRADLNLELTGRELASERETWLSAYRSAVEVLRREPAPEAIEARHRSIEDEFQRGLIPASLTVEAHRQMVDYIRTRHDNEMTALEALWSLYILDGRFEEVPL
jgi:outer membrane protein TolC